MSALAALGRTLADSANRDSWLAVHEKVIGSSTAGHFAKASSAETYVRQILEPRTFEGNEATRSGHRWEPTLLDAVGATPNSLFVHSIDNTRFATTVDGTIPIGDAFAIAEAKAKHNQAFDFTEPRKVPTPYEIRQVAWHLLCIPEAVHAVWVWGELVRDVAAPGGWRLRRPVQSVIFRRDDPLIVAATELIVPIAHTVIRLLDAAREEAWT